MLAFHGSPLYVTTFTSAPKSIATFRRLEKGKATTPVHTSSERQETCQKPRSRLCFCDLSYDTPQRALRRVCQCAHISARSCRLTICVHKINSSDISSLLSKMSAHDIRRSQGAIVDRPYSISAHTDLANSYEALRYPDLATGSFYKAVLLLDAILDDSDEYHTQATECLSQDFPNVNLEDISSDHISDALHDVFLTVYVDHVYNLNRRSVEIDMMD